MARQVFFSFHYERDIWRANQVRNSWVTQDRQAAGFWDAASWESVKRGGEEAIKRWIREQLKGTSVTAVLIGAETAGRKYVEYEIQESYKKGNGMLGIYIHNMRTQMGATDQQGPNPFGQLSIDRNGRRVPLTEFYHTYDWVRDNGYENFGRWVETAAP
jgi:hypothetical protein